MITDWTEARTERLKALFEDGGSCAVMARQLNSETGSSFSRNSIISKLRRLKLDRPRAVSQIRPKRRRQKLTDLMFSFKGGNGGLNRAQRMEHKRKGLFESFDVPLPTIITEEFKCAHVELKNNSCRYPLWDDDAAYSDKFYCGIPEADMKKGNPWCRHHHLVVYRPAGEENRQAAE